MEQVDVDLDAELERAVGAARQAGAVLQQLWAEKLEVLSAEGRDIKLEADRAAEAAIIEAFSGSPHPILTEESGEIGEVEASKLAWVVDPLDGTLNYSRRIPYCCVSIALCRGASVPIVGAIYHFAQDHMYTAVRGRGAFCNGAPIHVSNVTRPEDAIVITGFPVYRGYDTGGLERFIKGVQRFKKIRIFGAAALNLAMVASGQVDGFAEEEGKWWDLVAGMLLVTEAGGYVSCTPSERHEWGCAQLLSASCPAIWE